MNKLFLTLSVALFATINQAQANDYKLRPLVDYIKFNGGYEKVLNEEETASYIAARCFSLFTAMQVPIKNNTDESSEKLKETLNKKGFFFFSMAKIEKPNVSQTKFDVWLNNIMSVTGRQYIEAFNESYAQTGSVYNSPLIDSDIDSCKSIQKTIAQYSK